MKKNNKKKGQSAVLFALVIAGMMGFIALAIDGGMILSEKSQSQAVTDEISLTAAQSLIENSYSKQTAANEAISLAATQGFNNDGTDNTVTVSVTGPFTENGATVYYVDSQISSHVTTTFAQLFIQDQLNQTTNTQVRVQIISGGGPLFDGYGIIALDGNLTYPISFDGSGTVYSDGANIYSSSGINVPGGTKIFTEGGNIMVEETFMFSGSGSFKTDGGDVVVMGDFDHGNGTSYLDGGSIYVQGDVTDFEGNIYAGGGGIFANGDIQLTWSGHMYEFTSVNAAGIIDPPSQWFNIPSYVQWATPQGGLPPITIPSSAPVVPVLPKPDCTGLPNHGNFVASSWLDETINPGIYSGIQKGGSGTLTLNPGLYCVQNGDIRFEGGSHVISNETLFYIENGDFIVTAGTDFVQTAPGSLIDASGNDWAGMVVYLDPDTNTSLTVDGGAGASYSGTFYAPDSVCDWNNGVLPTLNESQLVCGSINITGGVTVRLEYNEDVIYQGGSGTPVISLDIVN